jgi:hypothetical protein
MSEVQTRPDQDQNQEARASETSSETPSDTILETAAAAAAAGTPALPDPVGPLTRRARLMALRDRGLAVTQDLWVRSGPARQWVGESAAELAGSARARAQSIDTKAVLASVLGAAATVDTKISTTLRKPGRSRAAEAAAAEAEAVQADGVGAVAPDAAPGEQAPVAAPAAVTPADPAGPGWSARVAAAGQGAAAFLSGLPQRAAPALAQGQQVVDKVTNVIARRAELAMLPKPSKWRAGLRSLQERVQKTVASESAAMGSQAAEWVNRVDTKGRFGVITRRLAAASASAAHDAPAAPVETLSVETVSVEARSTAPRVRKPRAAPKRAAVAKADETANAGVSQAGPADVGAAVAGAAVAATKAAPKRTRAAAPRKAKVQDGSEAAADGANAEAAPPKRVRARKRPEAGADVEA